MDTCRRAILLSAVLLLRCPAAPAGKTNNILLTGYWPPTNEAVRQFGRNPAQNPGGWAGRHWEGRGYDIFACHPEFPGGVNANPKGVGDFEVDYQDTSLDWERVIADVRPVAIMTLSRGNHGIEWRLEPRYKRFSTTLEEYSRSGAAFYLADYLRPGRPMAGMRIVDGQAAGTIVDSSLPMQAIADAVAASPLVLDPIVPDGSAPSYDFGGEFLSGYIGYHGAWHAMEHGAADAAYRCVAGGHIHVGFSVSSLTAAQATEISLRALIDYVDTVVPSLCPSDVNDDTSSDVFDLLDYVDLWFAGDDMAEFSGDEVIDIFDLLTFLENWFSGCD